MKKHILYFSLGAILLFGVLILRPIPIPPFEDCLLVEGEVTKIYGTEGFDIVFFLKDHKTRYYVNRGMEVGLNPDELILKLKGQVVSIYYSD